MRREVKEKLWLIPAAIFSLAGLVLGFCISWKAMCAYLVLGVIGNLCYNRYKTLTGSDVIPVCSCNKTDNEIAPVEIDTKPVYTTTAVPVEQIIKENFEIAVTAPVHAKPKKKTTKKTKKTVKE